MNHIVSFASAALLLFWAASLRPADLKPPASPSLLQLGKQIYGRQCIACHGLQGNGDGEAAYLL